MSFREKRTRAMTGLRVGRLAKRVSALAMIAVVLTSCGWQGIANVPLPGGRRHRRATR